MAPQAVLSFTPSVAVPAPVDGFDLAALGSFALRPVSAPQFLQDQRRPDVRETSPQRARVSPTVSVAGPFSLVRGGAVRVGDLCVRIERGTHVGQCPGIADMGSESRGLWWRGIGTRGEDGVWELQLVNATEADAVAVQRLLLYLPPISIPNPTRVVGHSPATASTYRNSLLLCDDETRRVVSVVPLDPTVHPRHGPLPVLPTLKPLPARPPPPPPPRPLSPGARIARYVDRVVEGIHPDPTPDSLSAAERLEQARIARQASREEKEWDPFVLGDILLATPTLGDVVDDDEDDRPPSDLRDCAEVGEADAGQSMPSFRRKSFSDGTIPSEYTISSLATFGTEGIGAVDEFDDAVASGRRSSFARVVEGVEWTQPQSEVLETDHRENQDDEGPASILTKGSQPTTSSQPRPDRSPVSATTPYPTHTLTHGNAVLLSFLGAPSSLLPSLSLSPSSRVRVLVHPLSSDEPAKLVDAGMIRSADFIANAGEERRGWFDWLSSLLSGSPEAEPSSTRGTDSDDNSSGWFGWIPWPWSSHRGSFPSRCVQKGQEDDDVSIPAISKGVASTASSSALDLSPANSRPLAAPSSSSSSYPSLSPSLNSLTSDLEGSAPSLHVRALDETSFCNRSRRSIIYVDSAGTASRAYVVASTSSVCVCGI